MTDLATPRGLNGLGDVWPMGPHGLVFAGWQKTGATWSLRTARVRFDRGRGALAIAELPPVALSPELSRQLELEHGGTVCVPLMLRRPDGSVAFGALAPLPNQRASALRKAGRDEALDQGSDAHATEAALAMADALAGNRFALVMPGSAETVTLVRLRDMFDLPRELAVSVSGQALVVTDPLKSGTRPLHIVGPEGLSQSLDVAQSVVLGDVTGYQPGQERNFPVRFTPPRAADLQDPSHLAQAASLGGYLSVTRTHVQGGGAAGWAVPWAALGVGFDHDAALMGDASVRGVAWAPGRAPRGWDGAPPAAIVSARGQPRAWFVGPTGETLSVQAPMGDEPPVGFAVGDALYVVAVGADPLVAGQSVLHATGPFPLPAAAAVAAPAGDAPLWRGVDARGFPVPKVLQPRRSTAPSWPTEGPEEAPEPPDATRVRPRADQAAPTQGKARRLLPRTEPPPTRRRGAAVPVWW